MMSTDDGPSHRGTLFLTSKSHRETCNIAWDLNTNTIQRLLEAKDDSVIFLSLLLESWNKIWGNLGIEEKRYWFSLYC